MRPLIARALRSAATRLRKPRVEPVVSALPRRDPAPTVWSYRYQRIMLTPLYRKSIRYGLPVIGLMALAAGALGPEANRQALALRVEALKDSVQERPAFMVESVEVRGADRALTAAIAAIAPITEPISSFDLDLVGLRGRIIELSAVRDAALRVRPGGVLEISVTQRAPVAIWRHSDGLRLIDAEGMMTGMIVSRADRADLPLIAGDGARDVIGEALDLFAAAAPIAPRVRGLVRISERRWDLILDGDQRVLLPADGAVPALERVIALHQAQAMLDRDVTVVDLRLESRPTVRLNVPALNVLRNVSVLAADPAPAGPIIEEE